MQLLSQGREEICENVKSENLTLSIAPIVFGADFQSMDDNLKNFEIGKDEQNNIFCAESYVKKVVDGESDKRNDLRGDEMSDRTGDGDNDERLRSDDFVKGGDKCCFVGFVLGHFLQCFFSFDARNSCKCCVNNLRFVLPLQ